MTLFRPSTTWRQSRLGATSTIKGRLLPIRSFIPIRSYKNSKAINVSLIRFIWWKVDRTRCSAVVFFISSSGGSIALNDPSLVPEEVKKSFKEQALSATEPARFTSAYTDLNNHITVCIEQHYQTTAPWSKSWWYPCGVLLSGICTDSHRRC